MPIEHIAWLSQIGRADESTVGSKAADLGEMTALKLPVPNGFVVSTTAYYSFLQQTGLRSKLEELLTSIDLSNPKRVRLLSQQAQSMVQKAIMPEMIKKDIAYAYHHLSSKDIFVAIRASIPENQADELSTGRLSKLNIIGGKEIVKAVQQLWSGLFSVEAIVSRAEQGNNPLGNGMAVIIQRMLEPECSGIVFTIDPISQNNNMVSIEAVWGLGEPLISGSLTPDHYQINRSNWTIIDKEVVSQPWQLIRHTKASVDQQYNQHVDVSAAWQRKQKLADADIVTLAQLAIRIEEHYGCPQDCEWVYADKTFYIVQTRPVITLGSVTPEISPTIDHDNQPIALLQGIAAAPGLASGQVRLIRGSQDIGKVKPGEVIVCQATDPAFDQALAKAVAVVVAGGGIASHAAAMARQLSIPAVVETGSLLDLLQSGEVVTVDGNNGAIYSGKVHLSSGHIVVSSGKASARHSSDDHIHLSDRPTMTTATKVLLNLSEPELAEGLASKAADGIGLLRAEYLLSKLAEHPQHLLSQHKGLAITTAIYEGLMTTAKAFTSRPVIYRLTDFNSREFARLGNGEDYELEEANPLIGFRGAQRFITDPQSLKLELAAVRKARSIYKNIWLLIPFIRSAAELTAIKQLMAEEGLYRSGSFKIYISIEVPAAAILLDELLGVGVDGVAIDMVDLSQLLLAVDRDNPRLASSFDESHPAVLVMVEQILRTAAKHGVTSLVYSQQLASHSQLVEQLIHWGANSVSVNPESLEVVKRLVAEAELSHVRIKGDRN